MGLETLTLPRSHLVVFGCFHQAQAQPEPASFWDGHRKALGKIVEQIVDEFQIAFIGEEAEQTFPSHAAVIADRRQIHYENLDIPQDVQKHIKFHPPWGFESGKYEKYEGRNKYVDAWNTVRERG